MRLVRYAFPAIGLAVLAAGCHDGPSQDSQTQLAQRAAPPAAGPAGETLGPPNEYRRSLTREAMRGLRYDTGRVEIDEQEAATIVQQQDHRQAEAEHARGQKLLARNAVIQAVQAHTKAVLLDPDDAKFYEGLGTALLVKRKISQAAAAFRTALDLAPDSISARFKLADSLGRLGLRQEAIDQPLLLGLVAS